MKLRSSGLCIAGRVLPPVRFGKHIGGEWSHLLASSEQTPNGLSWAGRKQSQRDWHSSPNAANVLHCLVKRPLRTIVVWLSILAMLIATQAAEAESFRDFFRALRRSIRDPQQKPQSHRHTRKQNNEVPPSDASNNQTSQSPVPAAPNGHNVRTAKAASTTKKKGKSALLYGTPVPGKQGLVTSPFSPDSGYIDVRSFPPGTEVKDPYTGKIFLTP